MTEPKPAKTILYVLNHIDWFWSHRLPLAKGAQEAGFKVGVAVTGAQKDKRLTEEGFNGFGLPTGSILAIIRQIRAILKAQRPDIVHAITLKYAFFTGLALIGLKDIRPVYTIAGLGYLFSGTGWKPKILRLIVGPFLRLVLKHPRARLIFQNPDDMSLLIKRGFARAHQCTLIRGSGVDLDQFPATPEPENTPPFILMPTRLVKDKGVAIFVEAANILKNEGVEAHFALAGGLSPNNPQAFSQKEMDELLSNGAFEWLGQVKDMPALLARANLIVYPSYYREGIPKVLLESCATGRAIITTDHPGCREAVTHGQNGLLTPVKNAQATAEAIKTLLNDPRKRLKMAKVSRTRAEAEFDVKIIVHETCKLYGEFYSRFS